MKICRIALAMWALDAVFSANACTTASNREFRVASVFHSALGRSEAGGGRNALSHCAEEKAGDGVFGLSQPPNDGVNVLSLELKV